jgi:hypothetical protein
LAVFVTKADGSKQFFDKEKVVKTCLKLGANRQMAYEIAEKIEKRLYDGIPTRVILGMIFRFMRRHQPSVRYVFDLRKGLSLMSSKPEFELFVQVLLANNGFEVEPNRILKGLCAEHEVDGLARRNGVTYFVEAKHHFGYHALTGLDESRIARAILEDVSERYERGESNLKIDRAMIVTNTRYSTHAIQYGRCRNILQIGWSYPEEFGLQKMIENGNLYPLSCLRSLKDNLRLRLVNSGIVLIKQLLEQDPVVLGRKSGLSQEVLGEIIEKAKSGVNALRYS